MTPTFRLLLVSVVAGLAACNAPAPTPPKGFEATGVPECDRYLTQFLACVNSKVPEADRPSMLQAVKESTKHWKAMAAVPKNRITLQRDCKAATQVSRQLYDKLGCKTE